MVSEGSDAWIREEVSAHSNSWSGEALLRAEGALFSGPFAATALSLAGIYGPGRYMLVRKAQAIARGREPWRMPAYTNRIHRDDAARMIDFLVQRALRGDPLESIYTGVDDQPCLNVEVLAYIMELLRSGAEDGRAEGVPTTTAPASEAPIGGKRVSNARMRALGFECRYPNFRAGYAAVVADYRGQR